eukprot:COSAG03_NODE_24774_length_270_cov_0.590643_1_plen_56_part_10
MILWSLLLWLSALPPDCSWTGVWLGLVPAARRTQLVCAHVQLDTPESTASSAAAMG